MKAQILVACTCLNVRLAGSAGLVAILRVSATGMPMISGSEYSMKATLHEKKLILFGPVRLTNGKPIFELKSVLAAAVEKNYLDIVIDLSGTQYIDSSGLGELVAA